MGLNCDISSESPSDMAVESIEDHSCLICRFGIPDIVAALLTQYIGTDPSFKILTTVCPHFAKFAMHICDARRPWIDVLSFSTLQSAKWKHAWLDPLDPFLPLARSTRDLTFLAGWAYLTPLQLACPSAEKVRWVLTLAKFEPEDAFDALPYIGNCKDCLIELAPLVEQRCWKTCTPKEVRQPIAAARDKGCLLALQKMAELGIHVEAFRPLFAECETADQWQCAVWAMQAWPTHEALNWSHLSRGTLRFDPYHALETNKGAVCRYLTCSERLSIIASNVESLEDIATFVRKWSVIRNGDKNVVVLPGVDDCEVLNALNTVLELDICTPMDLQTLASLVTSALKQDYLQLATCLLQVQKVTVRSVRDESQIQLISLDGLHSCVSDLSHMTVKLMTWLTETCGTPLRQLLKWSDRSGWNYATHFEMALDAGLVNASTLHTVMCDASYSELRVIARSIANVPKLWNQYALALSARSTRHLGISTSIATHAARPGEALEKGLLLYSHEYAIDTVCALPLECMIDALQDMDLLGCFRELDACRVMTYLTYCGEIAKIRHLAARGCAVTKPCGDEPIEFIAAHLPQSKSEFGYRCERLGPVLTPEDQSTICRKLLTHSRAVAAWARRAMPEAMQASCSAPLSAAHSMPCTIAAIGQYLTQSNHPM